MKRLLAGFAAAGNGNNLARGLRLRILSYAFISVSILVPCFWLPQIEAGDLASHTYNAWLTGLIREGKAPGLWLASQTNNVMFDTALSRLGSVVGFGASEKIVVCVSVLIFFWGSFSLVSAVGERPAFFLVPLLMVLTYGWTFHMGFLNFYLSIGLACAGLAVLWRVKRLGYLYVVFFLPFIWFAHPLGLGWMLAVGGYMILIKQLDQRWHILVNAGALLCIFLVRVYLDANFETRGSIEPDYDLGMSQLLLAKRYNVIVLMIVFATIVCLGIHLWQMLSSGRRDVDVSQSNKSGRGPWQYFPWPLQLYVASVMALLILPDAIMLPKYPFPVNYITSRFSIVTAIIACCALTGLRTRQLFGLLTGVIALLYFSFVYHDERKFYELERQAKILVYQLPQGARVFATIVPFRDFRLFTHHAVDRACMGHCFNVGNYEASTEQFRVRAKPGNRIVVTDPKDPMDIADGEYLVQNDDLPGWHIFQCGPTEVDLCMRPLQPGPLLDIPRDNVVRARAVTP